MKGRGALAGRRVVVTRAREGASGLVDALAAAGAEPVVVPLITTVVLASPAQVTDGAAALIAHPGGRWAVFTSATAARLVLGVVAPAAFRGVTVAAVGAATALALADRRVSVSLVPQSSTAAGLAAAVAARAGAGEMVWFPCAEAAGHEVEERLTAAGAEVRRLDLYRTDMPADAPRRLRSAMERPVDAVTLASGGAARHLVRALEGRVLPASALVACIGQPTATAAAAAGLTNIVVAAEPSAGGLVDALAARLAAAQPLP